MKLGAYNELISTIKTIREIKILSEGLRGLGTPVTAGKETTPGEYPCIHRGDGYPPSEVPI